MIHGRHRERGSPRFEFNHILGEGLGIMEDDVDGAIGCGAVVESERRLAFEGFDGEVGCRVELLRIAFE